MIANDIDISGYSCLLEYFDGAGQSVVNPNRHQIMYALDQLENEIDDVTRTVSLWRMPEADGKIGKFFMQLQGEKGKLLITVMKDGEMFATPSFDLILGNRGIIDVVGDEWNSNKICTNYSIATTIALSFGLAGKLAYPEIWTIWYGR